MKGYLTGVKGMDTRLGSRGNTSSTSRGRARYTFDFFSFSVQFPRGSKNRFSSKHGSNRLVRPQLQGGC